ncbi:hypothetical protein ABZ345_22350 [Lentzea sp. NPDC005914]|uniref:NucA/NucB deoxyribonuclease domain-containing protein n=1 Tax=Lentzea sp. NPDC005914 TaxID=3154572 RepID=UPI00340665BD
MRIRPFAAGLTVAALLTAATPALADEAAGWVATSTSSDFQATPMPAAQAYPKAAGEVRADDFKTECQSRPEARTKNGWAKSRFEQCFVGHRKVELKVSPGAPATIASVEFDYTVLAFAYDGDRRVDYTVLLDNYRTLGGQERNIAELVIGFSGCGQTSVTCTPSPLQKRTTLENWKQGLQFTGTVTSPEEGTGPYKLVHAVMQLDLSVESNMPKVASWYDLGAGFSRVRFDSAGATAGKFRGAVFTDHVPTYDLMAIAQAKNRVNEIVESARHIADALHHSERTFPSFLGKSIPGGSLERPLHRLDDSGKIGSNRAYAGKVCKDVWGIEYEPEKFNCDEYPFASTREGAYTSTDEGKLAWHGSARPIEGGDNQLSGTWMNTDFYKVHRVLDGDPFVVKMDL